MKVAQVAKSLGVALNSVYRKVKQCETELNVHVVKENGITFITADGVEVLRGLFSKLNSGESKNNQESSTAAYLREIIEKQQKTIDTLISKHADVQARQAEERARTDTIIMKLTNDVGGLQKRLEHKPHIEKESLKKEPIPVRPWKPEERIEPMTNAPWAKRLFVSLFTPEKLRSTSS